MTRSGKVKTNPLTWALEEHIYTSLSSGPRQQGDGRDRWREGEKERGRKSGAPVCQKTLLG